MTFESFRDAHRRLGRKKTLFVILFFLLAVGLIFITVGFGVQKIGIVDAWKIIWDHLFGQILDPQKDDYVFNGRLARAIVALFAGAGLGVAGAVMQNIFRNPMAEPYTMGISSGAFMGVTLSIIAGVSVIPFLPNDLGIVGNAFVFSLVPVAIILIISKMKALSPTMMILIGIAVMFMFSQASQILMITSSTESMANAFSWRVGTLSRIIDWSNVPLIASAITLGIAILWILHRRLNVMYAGDRFVSAVGEDPIHLRILLLIVVSLMTAVLVSFLGTLGFIGLVGPHIARIFVGSNNKYLIPASAAFGAAFVIACDTIAKVSGVNGLPVGVICSMIGGPLFIWILIRTRKSAWA